MNVHALLAAVKSARGFTASKSTLDVLRLVRLTADGVSARVGATNLYSAATFMIGLTDSTLDVCVDPEKLLACLSGREMCDLSVDGSSLIVKAGRGRYKVPAVGGDSMPEFRSAGSFIPFAADGLLSALSEVVWVVPSVSFLRPELGNACVRVEGGRMTVTATNGFAASQYELGECDGDLCLCVPKESIRSISSLDQDETMWANGFMRLVDGDDVVTLKVTHQWPTLPAAVWAGDQGLSFKSKDMQEAITRMLHFGSELSVSGGKRSKVVGVEKVADGVRVFSVSGEGEDVIDGDGSAGTHHFLAAPFLEMVERCGDMAEMAWVDGTAFRSFSNGNWRGSLSITRI